jgi:hypothetical protein
MAVRGLPLLYQELLRLMLAVAAAIKVVALLVLAVLVVAVRHLTLQL